MQLYAQDGGKQRTTGGQHRPTACNSGILFRNTCSTTREAVTKARNHTRGRCYALYNRNPKSRLFGLHSASSGPRGRTCQALYQCMEGKPLKETKSESGCRLKDTQATKRCGVGCPLFHQCVNCASSACPSECRSVASPRSYHGHLPGPL